MLLNPWEIAQPTRPDSATTTASVTGNESLAEIEVSPLTFEGNFAELRETLAGCEGLIADFDEARAGCDPLITGFAGTFTELRKSRVEAPLAGLEELFTALEGVCGIAIAGGAAARLARGGNHESASEVRPLGRD